MGILLGVASATPFKRQEHGKDTRGTPGTQLQPTGASGALTFQITPEGEGSKLSPDYDVGGYYPGGLTAIAAGIDAVLGEQLMRLKRLIETGEPAAKEKPR
jgi:hypothetical protein